MEKVSVQMLLLPSPGRRPRCGGDVVAVAGRPDAHGVPGGRRAVGVAPLELHPDPGAGRGVGVPGGDDLAGGHGEAVARARSRWRTPRSAVSRCAGRGSPWCPRARRARCRGGGRGRCGRPSASPAPQSRAAPAVQADAALLFRSCGPSPLPGGGGALRARPAGAAHGGGGRGDGGGQYGTAGGGCAGHGLIPESVVPSGARVGRRRSNYRSPGALQARDPPVRRARGRIETLERPVAGSPAGRRLAAWSRPPTPGGLPALAAHLRRAAALLRAGAAGRGGRARRVGEVHLRRPALGAARRCTRAAPGRRGGARAVLRLDGPVEEQVLVPLARGRTARYAPTTGTPRAFTRTGALQPAPVVLVEGVGAGRRALRPHLACLLWMAVRARGVLGAGLRRDGPD